MKAVALAGLGPERDTAPGDVASSSFRRATRPRIEASRGSAPDAFDLQVIEPLEFIDSGDKVLVKQHVKSRGAGSGIELEGHSWSVWTVNEDGLATRVEGFLEQDEAQAREAAGLGE